MGISGFFRTSFLFSKWDYCKLLIFPSGFPVFFSKKRQSTCCQEPFESPPPPPAQPPSPKFMEEVEVVFFGWGKTSPKRLKSFWMVISLGQGGWFFRWYLVIIDDEKVSKVLRFWSIKLEGWRRWGHKSHHYILGDLTSWEILESLVTDLITLRNIYMKDPENSVGHLWFHFSYVIFLVSSLGQLNLLTFIIYWEVPPNPG